MRALLVCALGSVLAAALLVPATAGAAFSGPPRASWYTNGSVNAVASSQDGTRAFIGGEFDYVGTKNGPALRVDATSGDIVGSWPKFNGAINAVVEDGSGGWYVGGGFTTVGGSTRSGLAHITSIGSLDTTWTPAISGQVKALARSGTSLYVGGAFTNNIARVDTVSGSVGGWGAAAFNGTVTALDVANGYVYVGGAFSQFNSVNVSKVVRLAEATGVRDTSFATDTTGPTGGSSVVRAIDVAGTTTYVAGSFSAWNALPRKGFVALDASGAVSNGWDANSTSVEGRDIAVRSDGLQIIVAGDFTSVGASVARAGLAALNPAGATLTWNPSASGSAANVSITSVEFEGTQVYVSGTFSTIGGQARVRAARIDSTTGVADGTWNPRLSHPSSALIPASGSVIVGGDVASVGGVERRYLAAIDTSTDDVLSWKPAVDNTVHALLPLGNLVYVGGFAPTNGLNKGIRAFSMRTGLEDGTFAPVALSAPGSVRAMTELGGTLYFGGSFTSAGGSGRANLGAVSATTGALLGWAPSVDGEVKALTNLGAGSIYVGGSFSSFAKAFTAAGADDNAWSPNINGVVRALVPSSAPSGIIAGGDFTSVGASPRDHVALLSASGGSVWTVGGANGPVYALAGESPASNSVVVGGGFTTLAANPRTGLGELDRSTGNLAGGQPAQVASVDSIGFVGRSLLVGTPDGAMLYESDTALDTTGPIVDVLELREAQTGVDPTDGSYSPNPNAVIVRPGIGRTFTVRVRAHDQYTKAAATQDGAVTGLKRLTWGDLPASAGAWTPGTSVAGKPRGLVTRCWSGTTVPGADGTETGIGISRNIDFGAGRLPDELPQLPAVLTWGGLSTASAGNVNNVACRWSGAVISPVDDAGAYTFQSYTDEGFRANVEGLGAGSWNAINHWAAHAPAASPASSNLTMLASEARDLTAEWFDGSGTALATLNWHTPSMTAGSYVPIPANALVTQAYYERTYTMQSASGAPNGSHLLAISATDQSDLALTTSDTVTVTTDAAEPQPAASFTSSVGFGPTNATTIAFSITDSGGDVGGAGIFDRRLQREAVPFSGGVCGTSTDTWVTLDTVTTSSTTHAYTDSGISTNACYRYRYVSRDNVGNQTIDTLTGYTGSNWIIVDRTAPNGGSVASPVGYVNVTTVQVTGSLPTDAETGIDATATQIQRASAPLSNGTCGTWTSYLNVGSAGATLPWTDTAANSGACYSYQVIAKDRAGNPLTVMSAATTKVDTTPPTSAISSPSTPSRGTVVISGLVNDPLSTVASIDVTYAGPATGTICTNPPRDASGNWSCSWNTASMVDGTYVAHVTATDAAGNASADVTSTRTFDNTAPVTAFGAAVETANPDAQHYSASGNTVWFRAGSSGSTSIRIEATDLGSGMDYVAFGSPTAAAGWTGGGAKNTAPYEMAYAWTSATTGPNQLLWTALDVAGNSSNGSYEFRADATAPTGASITYGNGVQT
ncbi:MAG: hypothetical protein JWM86_633, partial [Thermoleophilia bacterium]|nr:hypothetical protein [Thermoleophilia bacterium]